MSTSSTDLVTGSSLTDVEAEHVETEIVQHPIRHVYCAKCDEDVLVNERKKVGITATLGFLGITCISFSCIHDLLFLCPICGCVLGRYSPLKMFMTRCRTDE
ncbi:hypothetical protein M3Y96_00336500 [Aphelenchoides besseyi]|nr:hypothetical protein M3Y96_00336500 [Aphelenchoides besseyi]